MQTRAFVLNQQLRFFEMLPERISKTAAKRKQLPCFVSISSFDADVAKTKGLIARHPLFANSVVCYCCYYWRYAIGFWQRFKFCYYNE